ncbi:unnamed protein product [Plutella xylostella]|uniref:(diamondback moth) hypothetical protein n=1 Tax=Plutella xylostella TaxID=51655 RepID=A0A8S4DTW0_PLUXY|nr:unnamed protein product [Plutella xylostella]
MDVGKSSSWPPGPTVCRCCLAEGCYKDISTEYFWMGKREVYAEMLTETFDLAISYAQSAGTNSNSRLICEPCISRLRDASEFKRQVSECERMFTTLLEPGSSGQSGMAQVTLSRLGKDVKVERVKVKKEDSEDDDDDDMFAEPFGDDDDDDDADDEPLTNLATKIPKKEAEDDIFGSEDKPKPAEKRKATVKAKAVPAKKAKATVTKAKGPAAKVAKPQEKKKRDEKHVDPARRNAEIIIKYTTAYPFRVNVKSMLCVYCLELYDDPSVFRSHMEGEHPTFSLRMAFDKLPKTEFIKIDLSNLKCRICTESFTSLDDASAHLKETHNKAITLNVPLGVMPYRMETGRWSCAVCSKSVPSLLHLNKHTITHFLTYVCDTCGKGYVSSSGLLQHVKSKHDIEYKARCRRCHKVFPSLEAKMQHHKVEKRCMTHCCSLCPERFAHWESKQRHMSEAHGQSKNKKLQCPHCEVTCSDRRAYYDHFKMFHSQEYLVCMHCGLKFASASRLSRHLGKHAL